jgi:hypothetical protein
MSLMDRFAAGLETLGRKANQALDEGKLRMDLLRTRRRLDHAARALGYTTYRQNRGEAAPQAEIDSLTRRMAEAEAEAARLEAEIARLRAPAAAPPGPAPGPEPPGRTSTDAPPGPASGPAPPGGTSTEGTAGPAA